MHPLQPLCSSPTVMWVSTVPERDLRASDAMPSVRTWWLDGALCRSERELLAEAERALSLPGWYGHNWDALADCLSGLAGSNLLVVLNGDQVLADAPDRFAVLVEVLRSARQPGTAAPFQVVFVTVPGAEDALVERIGGQVGRLGPR